MLLTKGVRAHQLAFYSRLYTLHFWSLKMCHNTGVPVSQVGYASKLHNSHKNVLGTFDHGKAQLDDRFP